MKKEKRLKELLKIFKGGVCRNPGQGLEFVLEFQDIIGAATSSDLADFYKTLSKPTETQHFLWVCLQCLCEDMAMNIIKECVVIPRVQKEIDAQTELLREAELDMWEEQQLAVKAKKTTEKEVKDLRKENEELKKERALLLENIKELEKENNDALRDAEKYWQIKELLVVD